MSVGPEVFGEDYLYFYESFLTDEVSDRQAELVWRLLQLEPGTEVLDVACGHGRIANRLARRGARVTGLDADRSFLERARMADTGAVYVEGDMRSLPFADASFDAALLWFTALGYFDDEGNRTVLSELRRILRHGGRVVLELQHLPFVLANWGPDDIVERDGDRLVDRREWNPEAGTIDALRTTTRDGVTREVRFSVRVFMPDELRTWLLGAGFAEVDLLDQNGEPLTPEGRRLIALART